MWSSRVSSAGAGATGATGAVSSGASGATGGPALERLSKYTTSIVLPLGRTIFFIWCPSLPGTDISITPQAGISTAPGRFLRMFMSSHRARLHSPRPMVLSDRSIREEIESGRVVIDPYDASMIQPSRVDVRVGRRFRVFHNPRYPYIDVRQPMEGLTELVEVRDDEPFILHPGEFVLGQTLERVTLPDDLVARLEGKSSLGRL